MHHTTGTDPVRRRRRPRRSGVLLGALLALALGLGLVPQVATAAPAQGRATAASAAPKAPSVAVCGKPKPGQATCFARRRTDVTARAGIVPMATPSGYGPTDLKAAYDLPDSGDGTPLVAIVDAYDDPNAEADLAVYRKQYGLPDCTTANGCFRKVDQRGGAGLPVAEASWSGEISLDLDMVSAVAPGAHILLVEADSAQMTDLAAAVDEAVQLGAGYVTNSYGASEQPAVSDLEAAYDHPGVVITASSGDYGLGSSFPATSPHVTAVGGTTLTRDPGAPRGFDETAWNLAGSGCSAYFTKPAFQHDTVCPKRSEADVSAVSDPATGVAVYDSYQDTGWGVFGGTSAASPIVAAVYALAGPARSGTYPNSYPYQTTSGLTDVTSGSNGSCGTALCTAGPGWDGPTGLGTPDGLSAFRAHGDQGRVAGTVTDSATGKPVAGATVAAGDAKAVSGADGGYTLTLPVGAQTLTATAFGYGSATHSPQVAKDTTTVADFALTQAPKATVEGTVTDGSGHGWPVYAKITVPGRPGPPVYTDPVTGTFSLDLPLGTAYTLKTSAVAAGYQEQDVPVDLTASQGGSVAQDIALKIHDSLCYAPGYGADYTGGHEDFSTGSLPTGWTVNTTQGEGGWTFDDTMDNQTGGTGSMATLDAARIGFGSEIASDLTSPVYDLSGVTAPVVGFHSDYKQMYGGEAFVQLSTDGGATWNQIWKAATSDGRGPALVTVPVPQAAGQSQVRLRFHYGAPSTYDYWWAVDDAFVGTRACAAQPGGMVTGKVTDKNTGAGLNAAKVSFGDTSATTAATADDTARGDGFYQEFVPASAPHVLSASAPRYTTTTADVVVRADAVTRADVALPAGRIEVAKSSLSSVVTLGGKQTVPLTISNTGTSPSTVTLHERGAAFQTDAAKVSATAQDHQQTPLQRVRGTFSPLAPTTGVGTKSPTAPGAQAAPADGPWTGIADYPQAIMDNATGTYQGKLYSFGGAAQQTIEDSAFVYDPVAGTWTPIAKLPEPRDGGSGAFIGGKFYLTGGWGDGGAMVAATDIYDPVTDSWSTGASVPRAYAGAGTAVLDGKLYLVGGCDIKACGHTDVQVYDPTADSWSRVGAYPFPVAWQACGGIDGQLYCAGGDSATATYWAAERYDPRADAWTSIARMPVDLWGASSTASGGLLVVSGGVTANNSLVTNEGWAYDPVTDTWQAIPDSPNAVYRAGSACGMYQVGGSKGSFSTVPTAALLSGYDQCGGSTDVDWLAETPATVTVPAGGSVTVQVTTDSAATAQPGLYTAELVADQDTPYSTPLVGVTMTVAPPKSWGRVTGTVSGAGCSSTTPLADALVEIDSTDASYLVRTAADGSYTYWLDKKRGAVQIIVAATGWRPSTAQVKPVAGNTVTTDFTLQPVTACG